MSATRHGAASEPFAVARLSRGPALRSTTFTNEEILGAIRRWADSTASRRRRLTGTRPARGGWTKPGARRGSRRACGPRRRSPAGASSSSMRWSSERDSRRTGGSPGTATATGRAPARSPITSVRSPTAWFRRVSCTGIAASITSTGAPSGRPTVFASHMRSPRHGVRAWTTLSKGCADSPRRAAPRTRSPSARPCSIVLPPRWRGHRSAGRKRDAAVTRPTQPPGRAADPASVRLPAGVGVPTPLHLSGQRTTSSCAGRRPASRRVDVCVLRSLTWCNSVGRWPGFAGASLGRGAGLRAA